MDYCSGFGRECVPGVCVQGVCLGNLEYRVRWPVPQTHKVYIQGLHFGF